MTNPTLSRLSGSFSSSASTTLTLYNGDESSRKDAGIINIPIPLTDASNSIAFDLLGVTRTITIKGTFVAGASPLTLANFCADLDSLIQGNQGNTGSNQSGYTYSSPTLGSSLRVYVQDSNWNIEPGNTQEIGYSITLLQTTSS